MSVPASYGNTFTLPKSGRILMPFDKSAFIESLPVYCGSYPQAIGLRALTRFLDENYYFANRACPSTQQPGGSNSIASQQSYDDQISIPAGSFLTMIAGHTDQTDAGFRVRLYDAGAQDEITQGYINDVCVSGQFVPNPASNGGFVAGDTAAGNTLFSGLMILQSPLSIASPGQLNVQITNLSANTAIIDMAFFFACPANHMQETGAAAVSNRVTR